MKMSFKLCALTMKPNGSRMLGKSKQIFISQLLRNQSTAAATESKSDVEQIDLEKARPLDEIPTQSAFQFFRSILPGGKYYKKDITTMMDLIQKEYGDVFYIPKILGQPPMLVSYNPDDFETVFRNEGIWPNRPGSSVMAYHREVHRADFFENVEGLITTKDEKWGKFRSAVNPVLMQPKNVRMYLLKMAQVNQEFIERIQKLRDPQTNEMPENFESEINRWTLESVSVVALDKQLGLLRSDQLDPLIQKLLNSITDFITIAPDLDMKPSAWKVIPTKSFKRIMQALDNIQEITSHYVNEAINRLEEEKRNGIEKADSEQSVLEKLLKINPKLAAVMSMDMLMAGVDTTTSMFTGTMLCLAKNPQKQEKLREELRRVLPNKDSAFTEKSLNDIPYLKACIKESLRLFPVVLGNGRVVQRDVVISGYRVPKGTAVLLVPMAATFDEQNYPHSREFIPERWLRPSKDKAAANGCPNSLKSSNPFMYLPFGFGPRSCIGKRIADMEVELGVARIIRNFKVSYNYPTEKPFKSMLINVPNIPLKFQFTDIEI